MAWSLIYRSQFRSMLSSAKLCIMTYRVIVNECYKNKQVTCNKYYIFFVVTCLDLLSMSGHLLLIPI